jgi:transcriptional regulator with XRE-family HTH domain
MTKYITLPCNECGQPNRVVNGQWLREIRESANLSQREFGKLANCSSPYISDIERNRRSCPSDILEYYLKLRN